MLKKLLHISFLFLLSSFSFGQEPSPTPAATSRTQIADSDDVVKISTVLVQIDVTVKDKNGKIIRGLKPSDFEIYENGVKRDITNFAFVEDLQTTSDAADQKKAQANTKQRGVVDPPIPSARLESDKVRRTIAIVVDDLGLSFESMSTVRKALQKFVTEQMRSGDLVAIVRTSIGLGGLQQFTSDERQLLSAIDNLKWNPRGRSGTGAFAPVEPTLTERTLARGLPTGTTDGEQQMLNERVNQERDIARSVNQYKEDIFVDGTLGAINYVVNGLRELPGRKSLMLFSDGLSVCSTIRSERCGNIVESMRRLADIVNRASVSIYSFDARGVAVTALGADDTVLGQSIDSGRSFQNASRETMLRTLNDRTQAIYQGQDGLKFLAKETGGLAFFNSNDLNGNMGKALEDQRGYYLVGYEPPSESFDPKLLQYNKIEVKVLRPEVSLRYRSGFFGIEDSDIGSANLTAQQEIYKALTSPFGAKGIGVRINTLFGMDPQAGIHMRALLHVDIKDLKFVESENGEMRAVVDLLAMTFGQNGQPASQSGKNIVLTLPKDEFAKHLDQGFVYSFVFPIKTVGGYQFGIAIRDNQSGKVGSSTQFFEIPKVKKSRLTMSGIILQNYTIEQWNQSIVSPNVPVPGKSDPLSDTSARKFHRGTILEFGSEIYNAKKKDGSLPQVTTQLRLFRDGQLVLNGKPFPVKPSDVQPNGQLNASGALKLGVGMPSGDYILQIVITDLLANEKDRITTEWVQFQIVD